MTQRWLALLGLLCGAVGCTASDERREAPDRPISVTDVGFQTPESVVHDTAADLYLVSNINGNPLDKDDNGFISRVTPEGAVRALKWIDGQAADVTLHAPKGLAIKGDTLFAADIDTVRLFDRRSGIALGHRGVPGATFLNDIAVGPEGTVYVTDSGLESGPQGLVPSGTDAVYLFDEDGAAVALTKGTALGGPNGIVVDGDRIMLVTFGTGEVFFIRTESGLVSGFPKPPGGQLDGVIRIDEGTFLISSWGAEGIYRTGAGGQYVLAIDSLPAPADLGYDARRHRALIPLFTANRVEIRPLGR